MSPVDYILAVLGVFVIAGALIRGANPTWDWWNRD
jgi:hypothetical protein